MDDNEGTINLGHPVPPQETGHRRQQSLQDIIKFAFQRPAPPLLEAQRVQALARFSQLLAMYRAHLPHTAADGYDAAKVVELFHEYALLEVSKDRILRYFLAHVAGVSKEEEQDDIDLALARLNTLVPEDQQRSRITEFAEHLHVFFFSARECSKKPFSAVHPDLKLTDLNATVRAGGGATRDPSAALSPDRTVQRIGVRNRPPSLKDHVSLRERHRCAISGAFSDDEYKARRKADGVDAKDDDDILFTSFEDFDRMPVEAAHIIPHSIGARSGKNEMLNDSQLAALHLLDMFDSTATALIDGAGIDTPKNAILLSKNWHYFFGTFQVYFDKADNQANSYTVCVANPNESIRSLPRTVTFQSESIELPSPHLLALHKAVAKIMYLTGAGECTDHIDRYDSADTIAADGSTNLAILLNLRLFTSPIRAY
ncbi:MAG: hypothetical protein M1829_003206 [Trizodia sp. TS-e1964]|nr:MAG: hypothetical protein M1829_003206 [Trizodia sp. TS-e1964]